MKIKFELVNTSMSGSGVLKSYYFEAKSFKEFKDQISKHWITYTVNFYRENSNQDS
jgi:hypothetical protein